MLFIRFSDGDYEREISPETEWCDGEAAAAAADDDADDDVAAASNQHLKVAVLLLRRPSATYVRAKSI